ncbi:CRISPR-associated endoribonuclease Cas2, subtype TIGR01873 [Leptospira noguchii str. 2006001870]|uniref:type I-E CRISPR-associated endoribonuclease Cas2e n=1 Tax=Leptospira noguchii TaxID=28182 RepID=UPI0002489B14|nr:type I-E CRISPR-associated endoribonuclease Cas2e [Leptospira noguchii]EKR75161.1 CRISPR-associated endoribonuclease Cas2, subtype TIGR01873 [Leptospira noguchii str. 2006001870]
MSRLAIELKPGVFVATVGARVRDQIWKKICEEWKSDALMLYSSNTGQGYIIRSNGDPSREIVEFDGIQLIAKPDPKSDHIQITDEIDESNTEINSPFPNIEEFFVEKADSLRAELDQNLNNP